MGVYHIDPLGIDPAGKTSYHDGSVIPFLYRGVTRTVITIHNQLKYEQEHHIGQSVMVRIMNEKKD